MEDFFDDFMEWEGAADYLFAVWVLVNDNKYFRSYYRTQIYSCFIKIDNTAILKSLYNRYKPPFRYHFIIKHNGKRQFRNKSKKIRD